MPWHALRSAPVVIELEEVHLCLGLLDGADLEPGPAGERAWAAKQAQLALAELQAAQEGGSNGGSSSGSSGNGGGDAGEGRKGMLWSFLQHLVTMLVNRLQLRVRNVHVSLQVGAVAGPPCGAGAAQCHAAERPCVAGGRLRGTSFCLLKAGRRELLHVS